MIPTVEHRSGRPSSPIAAIAVVVLVAAAAGCTSPTSSPAAGPGGSSDCGRTASAGSATLTLTVAGHERTVIVHVPSGYTDRTGVPLVLDLHGSGSTAAEQELLSGLDATADHHGFVVAYPQGLLPSGSGFAWNVPGQPLVGGSYPPENAADDVAFLSDLVPALGGRYCIDASRVYATGISGGGRMASQLACDASGTFAAVAPVAGLRYPDPCRSATAVPILAFHGTADPIDPYGGNGQAYWTYSVPTAAQRWAAHNGCSPAAGTSSGPGYSLTEYGSCHDGASVELYTLDGEGHEWPGGPALPPRITSLLGPQSNAVDADSAMWAFFSAHPRAVVPSPTPTTTAAASEGTDTTAAAPASAAVIETGVGWSSAGLQGPMPGPGTCRATTAADGYALPDPGCTPGAVDAAVTQASIGSTICRSGYSSSVRPPESMTEPAKYRAMAAYGDSGSPSPYEYDHLVPLELGGASDVRNLWPEPNAGSPSQFDTTDSFGINAKDGVENRLHDAVCSGQVGLVAAQRAVAANWTTAESVLGVRP